MTGQAIICGAIAQKPFQAGHTWQFLQYLLGFKKLGWDVLFVDRLTGDVPADDPRLKYLADVMSRHGLDTAWTVSLDSGEHAGVSRKRTIERVADADMLINVMGFCDDAEILGAARKRVFLDTDPGFGQMWKALGLADLFAGHDAHMTIGERIKEADCTIPTCDLNWITTAQPVVLSAWPACELPADQPRMTTIASWRGAYDPIDFEGKTYGLRVHQFRRFAELPRIAADVSFELALHIHPDEQADLNLLAENDWQLIDPSAVAASPESYRDYIQGSYAELMIAKGIYVESRSGWFSERSICYLASGRPVLAQDTALAEIYPLGEGLLAFSSTAEAAAGVEEIKSDTQRHSIAARAIAEEYFDSDKVIGRWIEALA